MSNRSMRAADLTARGGVRGGNDDAGLGDAGDAAAAAAASAEPAEPAGAPEGEEGKTFDQAYVSGLRSEAANYRTQLREYESAFEGFKPDERQRFLNMAADLNSNPEKAHKAFAGVADRLGERLGISTKAAEEIQSAENNPTITSQQVEALVQQKLAERDQASSREQKVRAIFDEASGMDPAYKEGSDALVQLIHVAQHDPEAGGSLAGAHTVLTKRIEALQAKAVEDYREALRGGKPHPTIVTGGDPMSGGKPIDWDTVENPLKLASQLANERFQATSGN